MQMLENRVQTNQRTESKVSVSVSDAGVSETRFATTLSDGKSNWWRFVIALAWWSDGGGGGGGGAVGGGVAPFMI